MAETHPRFSTAVRALRLSVDGTCALLLALLRPLAGRVALLAERGASIAHCPAPNLKLGSGVAPIPDALAAGVNLAIGTDGAASNDRVDMLSELRLAALLAKGAAEDASVLPAPAVLEAATLGGAQALGLRSRIGSIEVGKEADLVAFRPLPAGDPAAV